MSRKIFGKLTLLMLPTVVVFSTVAYRHEKFSVFASFSC